MSRSRLTDDICVIVTNLGCRVTKTLGLFVSVLFLLLFCDFCESFIHHLDNKNLLQELLLGIT